MIFYPCGDRVGIGVIFSSDRVTILERMTTGKDWYESPTTYVVFQGFGKIQCVRGFQRGKGRVGERREGERERGIQLRSRPCLALPRSAARPSAATYFADTILRRSLIAEIEGNRKSIWRSLYPHDRNFKASSLFSLMGVKNMHVTRKHE